MSREHAREVVAHLVERYVDNRHLYSSNEAQVRLDFIDPLLEALGWDLANRQGLSLFSREVRVEESVELADDEDPASVSAAGNPDYTIQPEGQRRFFGSPDVSVGHVTVTLPGSGGHSPPSFNIASEISA
jgi:hypothetical protein